MKRLSFRAQIVLLSLTLSAASLILLVMLNISHMEVELHEGLELKAITVAKMTCQNIVAGTATGDEYLNDIVTAVFADEDVVAVCVCGPDKKELHKERRGWVPDNLKQQCPPADTLSVRHVEHLCVVSMPIMRADQRIGDIWLVMSEQRLQNHITESARLTAAAAALAIGIMVILGLLISRKIVGPIRVFEDASRRIGEGDMATNIDLGQLHREFMPLGTAFNQMLDELKGAFDELEHARDNLELKVQERTKALRRELSERLQAEQQLRKGRELLRATLESSDDGILVVDSEGKVTHANKRFAQMWRIPDDLLALNDDDKLLEHVVEQLRDPDAFISKVKKLYRSDRQEFDTLLFKDDRIFERYSNPLLQGDEISGRVWNFRDVTERAQSEEHRQTLKEQLERAQRMESLGILAGGVAHDLNNMLGPLVGYPELILCKLPKDSPARKQIELIGKAAADAADIIQDLLTLARRGRYELIPTDISDVVGDYLDSPSFQRLSEKHGNVELTLDLDENLAKIKGSSPHLAKVIMNLVVNALDAMPSGGKLTIETSQQQAARTASNQYKIPQGDYVILRVKDSGMGIDPEDADKIFEPYFSKKKMDSSGSGLGLSVVYGVVKDHRGFYDIISAKGEGAEFVFYFPALTAGAAAESDRFQDIRGTETILVVDDVEEQRDLAQALLTSLGYKIYTAENGSDAIDWLQTHKVDLVALDMIMEKGFDGLDTYREIINIHPGQRAIVVSGFSATDRVERMQELGVGAFVRKPYTRMSLGKSVREELDRAHSGLTGKIAIRSV
jgi:PAS domain S-box-containing protein